MCMWVERFACHTPNQRYFQKLNLFQIWRKKRRMIRKFSQFSQFQWKYSSFDIDLQIASAIFPTEYSVPYRFRMAAFVFIPILIYLNKIIYLLLNFCTKESSEWLKKLTRSSWFEACSYVWPWRNRVNEESKFSKLLDEMKL